MSWLDLSGRVAVVTGAGGGIGSAIALSLGSAGARLVLIDQNEASCKATAETLRAKGIAAEAFGCDTTDAAAVAAVAKESLKRVGPAEILANNAGILRAGPLESLSVADWNTLLGVNLTGYFICAQAFGRQMLEKGRGSIVHIASIAAHLPQPNSGAYSPSKAGVAILSRQLAYEWGPKGVRSNSVSPGLIRTPMSEAFYAAPGIEEKRKAIVPTRRIGTPQDIADAVTFLSSDRASYVNGADLIVDGGFNTTPMGLVPRPGF
jgi:glucose 1-dehydrogenase